jgi:hypothetical protein
LLRKILELEEKLLETQLQLERAIDEKLTYMLSIQKSPTDKTGLRYVAPPSDIPSTSRIVFVKPAVPEPPPTVEDKGNDKINGDVSGTQTQGARLLSINGLSRDLILPIIVANPRPTNPSTLKSHRRWEMINTLGSYLLFG